MLTSGDSVRRISSGHAGFASSPRSARLTLFRDLDGFVGPRDVDVHNRNIIKQPCHLLFQARISGLTARPGTSCPPLGRRDSKGMGWSKNIFGGEFGDFGGEDVVRDFCNRASRFYGRRCTCPELVGGDFAEEVFGGVKDLSIRRTRFRWCGGHFRHRRWHWDGGRIVSVLGLVLLLDGGVEAAELVVVGVAVELGARGRW